MVDMSYDTPLRKGTGVQVLSDFQKALRIATVPRPTDEEILALERWAGNSSVAAAYDALIEGRTVINLAKLIHPRITGSGREELSPLAVAPIARSGQRLLGECGPSYTRLHSGRWDFRLGSRPRNLSEVGFTNIPDVPEAVIPAGTTKTERKEMLVLFEADWQRRQVVPRPVDPALLKPISGTLFEVLAVWDLSEVEAAAISTAIEISNR